MLLDKLKLIGLAILLIGGIVALKIYNPFSHDNKLIDLAGKLAVELCECSNLECADRVSREINDKIVGQKVTRNKEVGGGPHTQIRDQIMYAEKCYRLLSEGKDYSIDKDDGHVTYVQESVLNDFQLDLGL